MPQPTARVRRSVRAVLFDMDGVITDTARVHARVWKEVFDACLASMPDGSAHRPFDMDTDYLALVDGRPRLDGVRAFLASRGVHLPEGSEDDAPEAHTVHALGKRKNDLFHAWLNGHTIVPLPGVVSFIEALRAADVAVAVFSASRNAGRVLRSAGVEGLFDVRVDGVEAAACGLAGKPDPAMLLEVASRLGVAPPDAAVVEDAVAGVVAATRGGFGLVIGVAHGHARDLRKAGAYVVVDSLEELSVTSEGCVMWPSAGGDGTDACAAAPAASENAGRTR